MVEDVSVRLIRETRSLVQNAGRSECSPHGGHVSNGGRELCSGYGAACLGGRLLGGLLGRAVAD